MSASLPPRRTATRATKVSVMHAQYPNARHSGFVLHADLSALGAGDRVVKLQPTASTVTFREALLSFKSPSPTAPRGSAWLKYRLPSCLP